MTSGEKTHEAGLPEWDGALDGAFQVLLGGKPLEDPAAAYGVYSSGLTDREPKELPYPGADEHPFSPAQWRFDFSESLFCFDSHLLAGTGPWGEGGHKGPRPFDEAFVAEVRAAATDGAEGVVVRGADLGPLLERHGVDLTHSGSKKLNGWLSVLLRVVTDGSLTEAQWEEALGAIAHPELRDHLRMLCLDEEDARDRGAYYCGADRWPFTTYVLDGIGCSLVAGWEFGESQAGTAVVRLSAAPDAR
ncbi:hypothetical protein [Streptomyces sp. NPDC096132]|uniref:hypothetical protein n=1 Tax=Streptomyces sp. NPDC096132 TaxID=3366075 RepID=UPI0037FFD767